MARDGKTRELVNWKKSAHGSHSGGEARIVSSFIGNLVGGRVSGGGHPFHRLGINISEISQTFTDQYSWPLNK